MRPGDASVDGNVPVNDFDACPNARRLPWPNGLRPIDQVICSPLFLAESKHAIHRHELALSPVLLPLPSPPARRTGWPLQGSALAAVGKALGVVVASGL